jgi:hypothetical protein
MFRLVAVALLCLASASAAAQDRPLPDLQPFLQEVRKHLDTDDERQSGYMYVETRRQHKLDKNGNATDESVKVVESYPGLPGEDRWEREISEDGKPVPAAELEKRDRERQKHVEEYARRVAQDPAKERAKQERERERDRKERAEAIDDAFRIYDIRMLGREQIEGHGTIVLSLTPRPGVKTRTRGGGIMRNFAGRAWISESEHELVRLDLEAIDTVSFGLGLLARVHKGSRASFQRRKVNDEAWLPAIARFSASARVGLVKVFRRDGTAEFSNYKKFNVDTSVTYTPPKPPTN